MKYLCVFLLACSGSATIGASDPSTTEDAFTSAQSTLMTFAFDSSYATAQKPWNAEQSAEDQLLYTIGQLNGHNSVGRLDTAKVSNVKSTKQNDGTYVTSYHVELPVAWGSKKDKPKSFVFQLPKSGDYEGLEAFTTKYKDDCVDHGAHDVDAGSMWYYYRPETCTLAAADVVKASATITVSAENTTGKYPEYDKVWEDGTFNVVGIFGKYEDGATEGDAGIDAYDKFVKDVEKTLGTGVQFSKAKDKSELKVTRADGKRVVVTAFQVDNPRVTTDAFDKAYNTLSGTADLIAYNGHAGLGDNVRALAQKGEHKKGQYQILFMNGCDTFAYVDGSLAQRKAAVNPDDPKGTKYLDIVTNAMPAYFQSMSSAMLALVSALANPAAPKTYEKIFENVDDAQFVLATGEEDNAYKP